MCTPAGVFNYRLSPPEQFQLAQPFNGAQSRKVLVKAVWVAHLGTLAEK